MWGVWYECSVFVWHLLFLGQRLLLHPVHHTAVVNKTGKTNNNNTLKRVEVVNAFAARNRKLLVNEETSVLELKNTAASVK